MKWQQRAIAIGQASGTKLLCGVRDRPSIWRGREGCLAGGIGSDSTKHITRGPTLPEAVGAIRAVPPLAGRQAVLCISGIIALMLLILMSPQTAFSAESHPDWLAKPYPYVVINQDVRGILTEFGRNVGIPVILTDNVGGRVRGALDDGPRDNADDQTAGAFLRRLSEANGLTWYFDNSILYVSTDQEFSTQVVEAKDLKVEAIVEELKRLQLMDERFSLRSAGNGGLISISGPPAFIAIVRQVIEKMRPRPVVVSDDPRVRVFRGGARAELVRAR